MPVNVSISIESTDHLAKVTLNSRAKGSTSQVQARDKSIQVSRERKRERCNVFTWPLVWLRFWSVKRFERKCSHEWQEEWVEPPCNVWDQINSDCFWTGRGSIEGWKHASTIHLALDKHMRLMRKLLHWTLPGERGRASERDGDRKRERERERDKGRELYLCPK